jgi:hypothetical protein
MKILIINIDNPHRSLYVGAVAALLKKKFPKAELTAFVTAGNEVLETTGVFARLHFFHAEAFFARTSACSNEEIHDQLRAAIAPIQDVHWDEVVNLSSNVLAPLLINFLSSRAVLGGSLDKKFSELQFSDDPSFHLARAGDDLSSYFHFSYLHRAILKLTEDAPVASAWRADLRAELAGFTENLRHTSGKRTVVLIDAGLARADAPVAVAFVTDLYRRFHGGPHLPVLLSDVVLDEHPLLRGLREAVGEVHVLRTDNRAKLSALAMADLLITDDLHRKAIADLGKVPSILLTRTLNLSDFSVVRGSVQLVSSERTVELSRAAVAAADTLLTERHPRVDDFCCDVYVTEIHEHVPFLVPLRGASAAHAQWWLGLRFFASLRGVRLPDIPLSPGHYRTAIAAERENWRRDSKYGILKTALDLSRANVRRSSALKPLDAAQAIEAFIVDEERRLS